ncbi:MAG: hypothetical protein HY290_29550 [Planctomycetia bacterium]|nr:hypothetical protein [Planctomycetia bacterium]
MLQLGRRDGLIFRVDDGFGGPVVEKHDPRFCTAENVHRAPVESGTDDDRTGLEVGRPQFPLRITVGLQCFQGPDRQRRYQTIPAELFRQLVAWQQAKTRNRRQRQPGQRFDFQRELEILGPTHGDQPLADSVDPELVMPRTMDRIGNHVFRPPLPAYCAVGGRRFQPTVAEKVPDSRTLFNSRLSNHILNCFEHEPADATSVAKLASFSMIADYFSFRGTCCPLAETMMAPFAEFMLADSFTATGDWWLPGTPDVKLHGTLSYSSGALELDVSGTLATKTEDRHAVGADRFPVHPCVHGLSNEGRRLTLLKAAAVSYGSSTKYAPIFLIVGGLTADADSLHLTSLSFYCTHLDTFINRRLLDHRTDGNGPDLKELSIKYVQPEKLSWIVEAIDAKLEFDTALSYRTGITSSELHFRSFVTITPNAPQDLDWFVKKMWRFCYLLTLLTDERVSPTGISIEVAGESRPCKLIYRTIEPRSDKGESELLVCLFHLGHVVEDFRSILNVWFAVNETMLDAIHLTMDAHRNPDQTPHGRFLLAAHAVEVISRATTSSTYMETAEYAAVVDVLNGAIPGNVARDHRESLKSRIKYGNEFAFHKRITALLESLSAKAREIVCQDPAKFARGIVDTRNYYTHFTDELRPKALTGATAFWATVRLLILARILLLKHLGIADDVAVKQLSGHHRLMQQIALARNHPECIRPPGPSTVPVRPG